MSSKSKNLKVDRPFDPALFKKAESIANEYQIVVWKEDGEFYGRGLEMPNVFGDGKTVQAAVKDCRSALTATVATLLELGEHPPAPAMEQTRNVQVNIRMNAAEREIVTQKAKQKGFRSISDYMRSVAVG